MITAFEASKVGIAKYLVPFIFIYNPSLLFVGPLWLTAFSTVTALAGVWALSAAIEGWLHGRLSPLTRVAMLLSSIVLLYPPQLSFMGLSGFTATIIGAALVGGIYLMRVRSRAALAAAGGRP